MYSFLYEQGGQWYGVQRNGQKAFFNSVEEAMRAAEAAHPQFRSGEYAVVDQQDRFCWYGRPNTGWCTDRNFPPNTRVMDEIAPGRTAGVRYSRWGG